MSLSFIKARLIRVMTVDPRGIGNILKKITFNHETRVRGGTEEGIEPAGTFSLVLSETTPSHF